MATALVGTVLRHIRSLAADCKISEQTDGALLRAFLGDNDQAAFEALLRRHGPMVLRVCLRTLGHAHDAEDALQATFLLLARKAKSIRKRESLASWLHGVAHRMATHAKRAAARRHRHESRANPTPPRDPALNAAWQELQVLLDEEIAGLPEALRAPFILCCLENKSSAEAARQLGLEEGTVRNRLSRARKLLQERLTRRGVSLIAVLAAAALGTNGASAAVCRSLVASTAQAATEIAGGQAAMAGLVSTKVAALTEGVLKAMILTKLKATAVVLLAVALAGTGSGLLTYRTLAAGQSGGGTTTPTSQTPRAGDAAQVPKLIDPLGSDKFADREKATKQLDEIGVSALAGGEASPQWQPMLAKSFKGDVKDIGVTSLVVYRNPGVFLLVDGKSVYCSSAGANNFKPVNETWKEVRAHADKARDAKHLFVLAETSIKESRDGGATWLKSISAPKGFVMTSCTWVDYDATNDVVYLMKPGSDLYKLARRK